MFVLSYVLPPVEGAAFGKSEVFDGIATKRQAIDRIVNMLESSGVHQDRAQRFGFEMERLDTGSFLALESDGRAFCIDHEDRAPNVCPCCGRLVKWGDHAFAGSEDAYCLGCYTWGDSTKISCAPEHTAHANPWSTDTTNARWHMSVVIDHDGETGDDDRYATDKPEGHRELWDDEDNALIAWPGLTREQIISVTITEITEES